MKTETFDTILAVVCATLIALSLATAGSPAIRFPWPGSGCDSETTAVSATGVGYEAQQTDPEPPSKPPHQPWPW